MGGRVVKIVDFLTTLPKIMDGDIQRTVALYFMITSNQDAFVLFFIYRHRLRQSEDKSFGNEVYKITYEADDLDDIPVFGAKYNFHLEGVVDCPEFLVYFPVLEK